MLFAKFKEKKEIEGQFTIGKVYLVDEGYTYGATDRDHKFVVDDAGEKIEFLPGNNEFEFLDTVYGVWLGPPPKVKKWATGDVKVIDEADEDKFRADGNYLNSSLFEILDETNLTTDTFVLDLKTNKWEKICKVDNDKFLIGVGENSDILRPPTDFRFAVQDRGVANMPLVFCVNNTGVNLTKDKGYLLAGVNKGNWIVIDDTGKPTEFLPDRFSVSFSRL